MNSLAKPILYRGSQPLPAEPLRLRSGSLTLIFEPETAFLRHLRLGDHEVVRAIYGAVRNQNWDTLPQHVKNLLTEVESDAFRLSFEVECRRDDIDFFWKGTVTGDRQGTVVYQFDGEARSSFLKNRIGLCLLHPIVECAGKPCQVEHADGTVEPGLFPRLISPHQPFKSIRAIRYEVGPGAKAEVRFEGEEFEMEDQRNWTDASFKTYSTPLEIPFPVRIEKGTRIQHKVTVSLPEPQRKILPVLQGRGAQFSISTTPVLPKPLLGLGMASHGQSLSPREIDRLKRLQLNHLRADLDLSEAGWPGRLRQASLEAAALEASLQLALHLTEDAANELAAFTGQLEQVQPRVSLWMVFHKNRKTTPDSLARLAREKLSSHGANILLAAGSDAYFTELNRDRPPAQSTALPCFSINPQVHAFDDLTLVENLGGQAVTVESAGQFCKQAVVISPITLRPRFNPNAAAAAEPSTSRSAQLPASVDPRQMSLFGAAWTLGSLSRLAMAGNLHSLTYYETSGWRGVLETEHGAPLPELFPSLAGAVFPVYHVLADLAGFSRVYPTHSSHPLQTEGLTLVNEKNQRRILIANFLREPQEIKIKTGTCQARVRYLDETNAEEAMKHPENFAALAGELKESVSAKIELKLLPYALARVDIV